jgi:hypothetical protein
MFMNSASVYRQRTSHHTKCISNQPDHINALELHPLSPEYPLFSFGAIFIQCEWQTVLNILKIK